jgi:hypothetical protein
MPKPKGKWKTNNLGNYGLRVGAYSAGVNKREYYSPPNHGTKYELEVGDNDDIHYRHGYFDTLESAQLAAESWLRERAREILEAVGEEQR